MSRSSTPLVRRLIRAQSWFWRLIRDRGGLILAGLAASAIADGYFAGPSPSDTRIWTRTALLLGLVLIGGWRIILGWGTTKRCLPEAVNQVVDRLEVGAVLLAGIHIGIQAAGGPQSWAQPLAYLIIAYLVGFNRRLTGLILLSFALGFQLAVAWPVFAISGAWPGVAARLIYTLLFAGASWFFVQAEIIYRRREHARCLAEEINSMRTDARDFRLVSSATSSSPSDGTQRLMIEAKLSRGAVQSIHSYMHFILTLLTRNLNLQTCVLLWLDASGTRLKIKEMVSESDRVLEKTIPAQAGALGGIVKNRILLNLARPRQGGHGIPYYVGPEDVGAFVGVPVLENGHLRGVLCADRREALPFSTSDESLLVGSAQQIMRTIQTERVLTEVERSKYEHERFYRASTLLNEALTLDDVYVKAFLAASEIVRFEFGAITIYNKARRRHRIASVTLSKRDDSAVKTGTHWPERLRASFEGEEFADNAGLVSMVVKNRHALPVGDGKRDLDAMIFTRKLRLNGTVSLVVLPLVAQDNAVGTIVLASHCPDRFPKHVREMLGVIANQVAVSVENAKMFRRMEEMATTDGLTGLPNHRTFQDRFNETIARSDRSGKPICLILVDVDHFKSVNDSHGHPVGDQVLKRVASLFSSHVRKIDLVARYGGEEFAIILDETSIEQAKVLCDRVRDELAAQVMKSDKGSFRVTASLGIASYPTDGTEKHQLIERADQALYAAKNGGRNRTVCFEDLKHSLETGHG